MIEESVASIEEFVKEVRGYLERLPLHDIDTLILGCTHYPLIRDVICAASGDDMRLVDSGLATAETVARELKEMNLLCDSETDGLREYNVTSSGENSINELFRQKIERFLGHKVSEVKVTSLENQLRPSIAARTPQRSSP